jgi:peptide/nickel transport system permease protein
MSRAKSLQSYLLSRLLLAPLMLWAIATLVFLLLRATPGDPVDAILGPKAPPEVRQQLRAQLGLNLPLPLQYLHYLGDLLRGDLGTSLTSQGERVTAIIARHFPATAELAIASLIIALVLGLGVGLATAARPDSRRDAAGRLFGIITYALPPFWAAMLVQLLFAVQLGWFPIGTRYPVTLDPPLGPTGLYTLDALVQGDWRACGLALWYLALPAGTLGLLLSGIFERIGRVNLRLALQSDYVDAARARGIPERRILFNHALRNALIPLVTVLGLTLAALLGGALLIETTYAWPGLANRLFEAISLRDYSTVQGIVVFFALLVVLASVAVDALNALIDPRIRY